MITAFAPSAADARTASASAASSSSGDFFTSAFGSPGVAELRTVAECHRRLAKPFEQARIGRRRGDAERALPLGGLVKRLLADAEHRLADLGTQLRQARIAECRNDDRADLRILSGFDADLDDARQRVGQVLRRRQQRQDALIALVLDLDASGRR